MAPISVEDTVSYLLADNESDLSDSEFELSDDSSDENGENENENMNENMRKRTMEVMLSLGGHIEYVQEEDVLIIQKGLEKETKY